MASISGIWQFNDTITQIVPKPSSYGKDICQNVYFVCGPYSCSGFSYIYDQYKFALAYADATVASYPSYVYTVGGGNWEKGWSQDMFRTIDFGLAKQEVSDDFYTWFTANATPQDDTKIVPTVITYNGSETTVEQNKKATMACANKKAITDIEVTAGYPLLIEYCNKKTIVLQGETAIIPCANKKLVRDVSVTDVSHALYNGIRLPIIPNFAGYPYAFIIKGTSRYDLVYSRQKYWYKESDNTLRNSEGTVRNMWLTFADMANGATWSDRNTTHYYWTPTENMWSNYDIPISTNMGTNIYSYGSEPVLTV